MLSGLFSNNHIDGWNSDRPSRAVASSSFNEPLNFHDCGGCRVLRWGRKDRKEFCTNGIIRSGGGGSVVVKVDKAISHVVDQRA